jgi:phosphoglycolate phosphatase-like HAD superfamily hydrolase
MKHFIFDFDGTIVDNFDLVHKIVVKELKNHGIIVTRSKEGLRDLGVRAAMKEYKISKIAMLKLVLSLKKQIHLELFDCPPVRGLADVLEEIYKTENLYILSTNKLENIRKYLNKFGLNNYFKEIFEDRSYFGKSHTINGLLKKIKADKKDIYYIGDEVRDVEAAKKSGIKSISAAWGFEGDGPLKSAKPDFLFHRPEDLLSLIASSV